MPYSTLTAGGQVTIPIALRKKLRLNPGVRLEIKWSEEQQAILIQPVKKAG